MKHLVYNGYIQYGLLLLSLVRIIIIALDDDFANGIRDWLRGITYIEEPIPDTEHTVRVEQELDDICLIRSHFLRPVLSCPWCFGFHATYILIGLTLTFPVVMTYINLVFATAFLAPVIYKRFYLK